MGGLALLVCSVMGAALLNPAAANQGPVVQTKLGALKGEYLTVKGKDTVVHSYLGVPFAKPPLGALRLAPPQPAEAWEGVRDATQQPHMCLQKRKFLMDIIETMSVKTEIPEVSEDCLYLNVYTPSKPDEDAKLPVMVWIHGGGFVLGAAAIKDGSGLAAYQNVVVVIIQYRLGLTGFFSTGDEHAPGNYGLLDQVAALRWVQENIQSFGGDPAKVTIFGESAGGVSVSLQMLSPLSAGLFHYAIAQSGTAAMDVLMTSDPLPAAKRVANSSGCDISSTKKMVECVMQLSEEELVKIAQKSELGVQITTDGQFLPKPAGQLLQNKEFQKVPLITGVTDDEGGYSLPNFLAPPEWVDGMEREKVLSLMAAIFHTFGDKSIHEALLNEYVGTTNDPIKIRDGFREMYGDIMFNIPARITAQLHKDSGAPVYLYEFQHTFTELKKKRPSFTGSDHADELHFVFGNCFVNGRMKILGQFTEKENELCKTMMSYWGNFARTGSPNGPGLTPWPEHGADAEYLAIGLQQKPGKNLKEKHYTFITETLPRLIREKKDGPVVQTKLGALKGEYLTVKGKDTVVHSYLGVPFAKPSRLAPPQPAEAWAGVREATQHPNICIQNRPLIIRLLQDFPYLKVPEASEDCLYLNVYTPAKPGEDAKLPVMVWIHGGALTIGGTFMQDGGVLSAYQNVVVVVIQYRLGILGFFSTGDEHSPGNYGLLDQVAALQWVQENIHSFGGDPGSVTIFGESAGGISVSMQILSPLSAGLFRYAIAESGTAAMDSFLADDPLPTAQYLANLSSCDLSSSKTMVDCVMKMSEEELLRNAEKAELISVKVAVDGQFLPKPVYEILQNQQFHKVPFITGINDDEGGFSLLHFLLRPGWTEGVDREQVLEVMPFMNPQLSDRQVREAVLNEYVGSTDDPIKIRDGVREMYGDLMFNIPARKTAKYHKDSGAPMYLYEFQHTLSLFKKMRPSFVGCDHGDEVIFVLGICFANVELPVQFTEGENELCRTLMSYWGNFARTGSPNGPGLTPWPEHGADAEYLAIGLQQKPAKNLKGKHYTFITETLPRLIREKMDGPVVQTKLGALKGEYLTVKGKDTVVHSYLGVPFAKPSRLAPPQPAEAWAGVREATQHPNICIQNRPLIIRLFQGFPNLKVPEASEDCLYLNVYTPAKPGEDAKLPVMVWIHGGALTIGGTFMQDGGVLSAYQNVVVVVIQYRLGILGFFSTGDEHSPGNYGLLDQVAALQWVQENIHSFGGDPESVTIFGESAGGFSVSMQILSPLSAGLFRYAIAESGTAAMDSVLADDPLPTAQYLANLSSCDLSSSKTMVDCVMKMSEEELLRNAEKAELISVKVAVDGQFLPKPVYEILQNQQFHKVPFITGINDDEGGFSLLHFRLRPGWTEGVDREQALEVMPFMNPQLSDRQVREAVLNEYVGSTDDPIKIRDGVREMYGDLMFNIPARKTAKYHKDSGAPVYLYEFQHTLNLIKKMRPSFVGCDHADELIFVFGSCFSNVDLPVQFTEGENELCRTLMSYWGNFARTGSPNGPGLTPWPEHGADAEYLGIGLEQKPAKNLKGKHYTFITETLPRLIREKMDGPVVQTKLGALKGKYLTVKGKDMAVHSYLGVPFAKPPLGPLRLAPPQPAEAWEGVRDATQQPYICIQSRPLLVQLLQMFAVNMDIPEISEDCLYLNVYTPAKPGEDTKLPVMVWIHGGAFTIGSASMQDGSVLSAYQNVVVVVIQYRLGVLGFFSTGDEHSPGNYGLLDQVAALQWVQKNIHSFGGDPGKVTIFGESAGGVSVSLQILSPLSAGLFHSAIAQSGSSAVDAIWASNPLPTAQHLANISGCDISSSKTMVDCVMKLSKEELLKTAEAEGLVSVQVAKDGQFLPKSIKELLQNKQFHKVPLMTGLTDDEGGFGLIDFLLPQGEWMDGVDREQVMAFMPFFCTSSDRSVHEALLNEYVGPTDDRIKIRDALREIYGDVIFNIPVRRVAKYQKDSGAPVYLYEFQHTLTDIKKKRPSFAGTDHGDELHFVFGSCFANSHIKIPGQFTEKENELCKTVMAYWGNFARTGSPNGPGLTPWPEHGADAEYLAIGLQQKPAKNLKGKHYTFITETLPRLIREKKDGPVVQTKLGSLKGEYLTAKGKDTVVHSYLGVPFAKPPLGPLRLAPPQPAEAWEGVRDATQQPHMCIQNRQATVEIFASSRSVEVPDISEDCLYLNIYTPAKPAQDIKLPVMVWIHGGGLSLGSASVYDGSILAAYQDVVVVLIQYRLGLLGFFSTGDEHAPGNYGLLDQVAALQWVQENIHSFGGDPGSVTIFGESAGGASVSFLLLSPLSAGLFHRAIAESGCAVMAGIIADPFPIAQHVANVSGCDISSTKKIAECVKQFPIEDIKRLSEERAMLHFVVTEDKAFLPKPVKELLQNQEFHKVPLMIGVNDDEFGWVMPSIIISSEWTKGMDREQVLSVMSVFDSNTKTQLINELLADEYLGSSVDPIKIRDGFREMMADIVFNIPALSLAKFHKAAGAPVYFYEFQHPPSMFQVKRPSFVGTDHGDELAFVFGLCFGNAHVIATDSFTEKENELCRTVMDYWGNFARTGSPNGPGLTPWPEHGADAEYLGIGLEQKPGKNLKEKHYTFMTETLPRLIREKKDGPVVQTKLGALKGKYLSIKGKYTLIQSYLGVPFAKPPLGPLRLAPPQPAEAWEGVRDATQQPYMCMQNRKETVDLFASYSLSVEFPDVSEDCLYLNIYTPAKPASETKLPVMVWIHGGGLSLGSASVYDGSILAAYQDVVVVLIQYRLGLLGFFSTGDEHAPGNYGLLDQVAALQWVQENIHSFGGDPGSVTIFGESAGGASVSFLLLSPLSAGLFHRAIAESGCAVMACITADPFPSAQRVANVSGCDISSTKKIAECVKQLPTEDIKRLSEESVMLQFVVTQNKAFLPKPVKELLQNQEFHKVPLMIGANNDEFGWVIPSIFISPEWAKEIDREQVLSVMSVFDSNTKSNELLADEYLGSSVDPIKIRDGFREMMADIVFYIPALSLAKFHKAAGAPVYFYEFQQPHSMFQVKRPSFVGADHGDEMVFVFGLCFGNAHVIATGSVTEKENELCRTVMNYWGNFARTGSPNGPGLTPWPEHGADAEYLGIGLEQKPGKNLKEKHYTFMTETLPRLIREKKDGPVVQTKLGALKGEYLTVKGKDTVVHSYLGVSFAKPPLGPLRLAPPQPAEAWEGVRDAKQQPHMCMQNRKETVDLFASYSLSVEIPDVSEDCLYLNIYTPAKPASDTKLPVMVFIHGGGFNSGSASIYDGSILAAYQDVVVVLIQYRLGLLGFFSTGDEHAPGNYGLLDQVAALQWVQENIHSFGGDPGSVTIFGESAGGISVSLLLLSPLSAGLFHRGIAESGCAMIAGIVEDPVPSAQHVANVSGCDMSSTKKIAECVKQLPIEDIRRLVEEDVKLKFEVTEDKTFLPKPVNELLQNQDFHKLPLMIGVNDDEFGWLIPNAIMSPDWAKGVDREQVLSIMSVFNKKPQWINELLADEYLGLSVDPILIRDGFRELMADIFFNIPALSLAKFHKAAGAPVYFYEFQHPPSMFQVKRPSFVGTDHGDEIAFVFGLCFSNGHIIRTASVTEKENELCRTVMDYWGNFARTGSPNGPGLTPWPEYGSDAEYLGIGLEQKPGKNLKAEQYLFMTEKLPELVRSAQEKKEHNEL